MRFVRFACRTFELSGKKPAPISFQYGINSLVQEIRTLEYETCFFWFYFAARGDDVAAVKHGLRMLWWSYIGAEAEIWALNIFEATCNLNPRHSWLSKRPCTVKLLLAVSVQVNLQGGCSGLACVTSVFNLLELLLTGVATSHVYQSVFRCRFHRSRISGGQPGMKYHHLPTRALRRLWSRRYDRWHCSRPGRLLSPWRCHQNPWWHAYISTTTHRWRIIQLQIIRLRLGKSRRSPSLLRERLVLLRAMSRL